MKFTTCLHYFQIVLVFSLLNGLAVLQTIFPNASINNEGICLKRVSQKLHENLKMMKMPEDLSLLDSDKLNEFVANLPRAEECPLVSLEKTGRLKRSLNESVEEKPPIYLLALEEVNQPGSKVKRHISKKIIPLRLYSVGKTLRKRSLVNESIVDRVIEKYFPKIKEQPPQYLNKNRREAPMSPNLKRKIRFFKQEVYPLAVEPLTSDKLDVISEANRTLSHISKLTECDSFEMPEAIKKPLISVLYKRISSIYADKNKIKNQ